MFLIATLGVVCNGRIIFRRIFQKNSNELPSTKVHLCHPATSFCVFKSRRTDRECAIIGASPWIANVVCVWPNDRRFQSHPLRPATCWRPPFQSIKLSKSNIYSSFFNLMRCEKDPLPAKDWQGTTLDASREGPKCIQFNSIVQDGLVLGQEDCLYLNVYVPQVNFFTLIIVCIC